ncbi:PREDICTED: decaprenyl-diphosphate synthase subunit 2-like [Nicrophorus vespilloides]|uniref:Decaprenyl-diphosphate synthase subunit 2-like n=1 Tax=Nicrophorus vespilloides TaxID=110193 RepID=A0ABM1MLP5_NICVS|nr:PREDICTED: decaprenyl-diphosphate synthase subunit 2-like [Nicrophorus vespilloides]
MMSSKLFRVTPTYCIIAHRYMQAVHPTKFEISPMHKEKVNRNSIVRQAEKVVGYPTSFLNLRWILNDEAANLAMHLKKLIGTKHPLPKITKNFLFSNDLPSLGLVILLVSKMGGLNPEAEEMDCDRTAGILHGQRVLAEVAEMIRTSFLVHRSLLKVEAGSDEADDLSQGNKIALLTGDYLLSKCFNDLALIRNSDVTDIISTATRDCSESDYVGPFDEKNRAIPAEPNPVFRDAAEYFDENYLDPGPYKVNEILGSPRNEWVLRTVLSSANLLGKSCQAAMILGNHGADLQNAAYQFGKHVALSWQARIDYDDFFANSGGINLVSAPVMLHLEKHPEFYTEIKNGCYNPDGCDYSNIRPIILNGTAVLETQNMCRDYARRASKNLDSFPDGDAKDALKKIINAL